MGWVFEEGVGEGLEEEGLEEEEEEEKEREEPIVV